jgi:hypothetical protein
MHYRADGSGLKDTIGMFGKLIFIPLVYFHQIGGPVSDKRCPKIGGNMWIIYK